MTETCPELLVVPLEALRVPEETDQVTVLFESALPLEVRVAVRVLDAPEEIVKLLGETDRAVAAGPTAGVLPKTVRLSKYVGEPRKEKTPALPELKRDELKVRIEAPSK